MLIGQFWGTGAAQGIPSPFCRCPVCTLARKQQDKNVRLRSAFRLSEHILFDMGPDIMTQSLKYGDLSQIEHIIVTHTHSDHLDCQLLSQMWYGQNYLKHPLHIYLTDAAYHIVDELIQSPHFMKGRLHEMLNRNVVQFHQLFYEESEKIGDITVTPYKSSHIGSLGENAAMYLIKLPDGRTVFYGLDCGIYLPEVVKALSKCRIDIFIAECARALAEPRQKDQHGSMISVYRLITKLYAEHALNDDSIVYLTHINHNYGNTVNAIEQRIQELHFPVQTILAWDGLKIL